ncbi:MAG: nicotinamide-nucleotide amidohydrolase family protein [Desulfuromusa sp.]|nr:nicotinamide-nucleotide amidohydrolase family protein [Desulfuromusa sp.]
MSLQKKAVIIAIGNELVEGKIVDTNSAHISHILMENGFEISSHMTIPDDKNIMYKTFKDTAYSDAVLAVITGGLGPTVDDMTREVLGEVFDRKAVLDETAWEQLVERFKGYQAAPTENNKKQAYLPEGSSPFYNSCGTAPGFGLEAEGTHFCVMPGIPREMKTMLTESLVPYITDKLGAHLPAIEHYFKTHGIGESAAGKLVEELMERGRKPRLVVTVQEGVMTFKLAAREGTDPELLQKDIDFIRDQFEGMIWAEENLSFPQYIVNLFCEHDLKLSLAESCTGGLAAAGIVSIPGCSDMLIESAVTYSNEMKIKRLGVREETLKEYGAVSEETAVEMALGSIKESGADFSGSVVGIAGPGTGAEDKPVGTVCFAVAGKNGYIKSFTRQWPGERELVRSRSVMHLYWMIREAVLGLID